MKNDNVFPAVSAYPPGGYPHLVFDDVKDIKLGAMPVDVDELPPGTIIEYDPAKGIPIFLRKRPTAPQGMTQEQFFFWLQGAVFVNPNPTPEQSHDFFLAVRDALKGLK